MGKSRRVTFREGVAPTVEQAARAAIVSMGGQNGLSKEERKAIFFWEIKPDKHTGEIDWQATSTRKKHKK